MVNQPNKFLQLEETILLQGAFHGFDRSSTGQWYFLYFFGESDDRNHGDPVSPRSR